MQERSFLLIVLLLLAWVGTKAQVEDYKITSSDSTFVMEVSRENREVKISLTFKDATQYDYVIIEKTDDLKHDFRQCAYIDFSEERAKNGLIEKKDKYPRSMYSASFYRVIIVSKEGVSRMYPAVRLPALKRKG